YDESENCVGEGSVLFCPPKHFRFLDPKLSARIEGDTVVVRAEAYARSVEVDCGADTVLEDNFFDMNAGERRIRILRTGDSSPADLQSLSVRVRSVYDIR
ncbi:MAG: glycoside hydrolase family 2 protein, partial [Oscillospiraceae bacterium]|nr:glycoside hydrolase family 2 protein [Oscillospiraceae bacterium]